MVVNDRVRPINALQMLSEAPLHLPYASKEGIEALQKQWVSLLAVQHPICHAERVPPI